MQNKQNETKQNKTHDDENMNYSNEDMILRDEGEEGEAGRVARR